MTHPLLSRLVRPCPTESVYQDRLQEELALVDAKGFRECFAQVLDILDLCKDVPHVIRGSAGCSLLCYLLGITFIDPIKENIPLARFMHELRADLPDIDIDWPWNRRDEVLQRVYNQFPSAARISNHLHYHYESALREVMRRRGHRRFLPYDFKVSDVFPGEEASIEAEARAMVGSFKGYSLHCGGIIVFQDEVPEDLMLGKHQIWLDKDDVEERGLIKIDILSNRALAQLMDIDPRPLESYPDPDKKTAELLSLGDNLGIILAESPVCRKILMDIQPRSRTDVALCLAMIRPAAASRGRKELFLIDWRAERRSQRFVYDDDALMFIHELLGCSWAQAELYRKAFTKHNTEKMTEFASRIAGHPHRREICEDLAMFREYSFCKSHALSYAYLVWALAYQKARNPKAFWKAALNNAHSMYRPWVHYQEAKHAGWKIGFGKVPWSSRGDELFNPEVPPQLFPPDGWIEFRKKGWWSSNRFMPGMYLDRVGGKVKFRGLIATARNYPPNNVSFVTLGYQTGQYVDLVLQSLFDFRKVDVVEGWGLWNGRGWIDVRDYKLERTALTDTR